jgi:hypothetical protein
MTHDVHLLTEWIKIVTFIAAICTTSVPLIYSFSAWYASKLGRLFMLKSVSFALAMDLTVVFMIWQPTDVLVIFWTDAIVLTFISASTASLAFLIWRMNHPKKKGGHREAQ